MSDTIITVERLSKRYLVGHQFRQRERYTALRDVIARSVHNFSRKAVDVLKGRQVIQGDVIEEFWALRNVNFEVKRGDVIGIVGRNGAGKSTLLKILSQITEPTEGRITLRGRVASLLEIGTGFHPELTGSENIFLNGAILGMTRREIRKKFDEIVAFADVERFLDTPIKRFSSGMQVRLAFAIAAHLEPDILIVDEVLAVGDAAFQKKCLGKMEEASRRDGRTVLFVSHNMGVVTSLCASAIWLDGGVVRGQGPVREVVGKYLGSAQPHRGGLIDLKTVPRYGSDESRLRLLSLEWLSPLPHQHGERIHGRIQFEAKAPLQDVVFAIGMSNFEGYRLLTYESASQNDGRETTNVSAGNHCIEFVIDTLPLAPDVYNLDIGCRLGDDARSLDYVPAAAQIEVVAGPNSPGSMVQNSTGVHLPSAWIQAEGPIADTAK